MQTQDIIGWRMLLCSLILKIKPSESYLWKMCLGYSSFTLFLIFWSVISLLHLQKGNIFILYTLRAIFFHYAVEIKCFVTPCKCMKSNWMLTKFKREVVSPQKHGQGCLYALKKLYSNKKLFTVITFLELLKVHMKLPDSTSY